MLRSPRNRASRLPDVGDSLLLQDGDPGSTDQARAQSLSLWRDLPAVVGGRAHEVDDDVWMLGIGLTGAGLVLDDL